MLTAILTIISIAAADPSQVLREAGTFTAPLVLPIPEGLRALSESMPGDGRWVRRSDAVGPPPFSGLFLYPPLDQEIMRRLRVLDRYPRLCQAKIDAARLVHDAEISAARQVAQAECTIQRIDDQIEAQTSSDVSWWMVPLVGLGCLGVGVIVGLVAGR